MAGARHLVKRSGAIVLAVVLGLAVFPVSAILAQENSVVRIGVLAPLTGANAADGQETVRGVMLAVEEANAAGGVAGHTFQVVESDVRDLSAAAVGDAVSRLLTDPDVQVVLSSYASLDNTEIEAMATAGMPYILAAIPQQTRRIIAPDPDRYWCCWSLTPSLQAHETALPPFLDMLADNGQLALRNRTVAIVSSDNAYSRTIADGMATTFLERGWRIVFEELVPFGATDDWRPLLARLRPTAPAVIVNTDYLPANAAAFLNQFLEDPADSLLFLQHAPVLPVFADMTGERSDGVLYSLLGGVLESPQWPRGKEVLDRYERKYAVRPGAYGAALYEMTQVYFDALRQVGDPADREGIGRAIGAMDRQVAEGRLQFDPATHLARQGDAFIPITFFQIQDGRHVMISPESLATGMLRRPPWMK